MLLSGESSSFKVRRDTPSASASAVVVRRKSGIKSFLKISPGSKGGIYRFAIFGMDMGLFLNDISLFQDDWHHLPKQFTKEFREGAILMILEQGYICRGVAKRLGMASSKLTRGCHCNAQQQRSHTGKTYREGWSLIISTNDFSKTTSSTTNMNSPLTNLKKSNAYETDSLSVE